MPRRSFPFSCLVISAMIGLLGSVVLTTTPRLLADQVVFRSLREGQPIGPKRSVNGEVLVEAADGGLLLRGDDGRIWLIQPDEILNREPGPPPPPVDQETITRRMLEEFPEGFEAFQTAHYVLLYQGDDAYARDVATLFEALHRAFFAYWKNQRVDIDEPTYPLVALVLADRSSFLQHAGQEIGETAANVIGYYHLESNRMTTFRVGNIERNIATIIHEATHQLAYNCGLQTRFADNPMWLSEGLAMFFESPDLSNPRGWRGVGRVNQVNLNRWRRYLPSRPDDSLLTLLSDDTRFRSSATAEAAYGESWALTYFLIRTMKQEYIDYLKRLGESKPLREYSGRERIEIMESAMGMTIGELDAKFVAYMRRVR
ncbi:DUF1570 domain-containing protein [Neorhodopirellula pilleata]|uniref:DUF1570 domain-containing protein n=1 Tax=Neorhodopirellula pilleata TaxID=2714738 RepID=A0A5C6A5A9_9BACT|nr:hypothetical protein Pla100_38610 [Neorhodopirellula pilleata]